MAIDRDALVASLEEEGLFVTEWTDEPDTVYPTHEHPGRETRVVLEGSMTITVGDREHVLGPGDRIDLRPRQPHAARVGPHGVRYLAAR